MTEKFGSDLVADLIAAHGFEFLAINPGASWRGLHDSLVNYADPMPELIVCTNEKIAVNLAHGWSKVTGKPGLAIIHNVVGLMQGTMGLYTAYLDQAPVMVLGGTGPVAVGERRPHIEWIHTAFSQGELVRNYVKWDDQPADAVGVVDGFARGYQQATTEPKGPVYLCYDLGYQEAPLDDEPPLVVHTPSRRDFPIDPSLAEELAEALLAAEQPAFVAGRVGRTREGADAFVELAELVGAKVYDVNWRYNIANTHPLARLDNAAVEGADLVFGLDVMEFFGAITGPGSKPGSDRRWLPAEDARLAEIRLDTLEGNGWLPKFQRYQPVEWSVLADTRLALPTIIDAVRRKRSPEQAERAATRMEAARAELDSLRSGWREQAQGDRDNVPISTARLAWELGEAIDGEDWVLTANTISGWARKLWDFDDWSRHPGRSLGTATQIGISMGVARAYKGTDKLVVDVQPDGDLLFDPGTMWTIAANELPMLIVMYNNRSYYNDCEHQRKVALDRGRDPGRANIGMDLDAPAPDFAAMARSFGIEAFGPIEDPDELRDTLDRAVTRIKETRQPILVDVLTAFR
jgi:acetolactate synthase I/II/III large subunit